jgi:hypothetical protein
MKITLKRLFTFSDGLFDAGFIEIPPDHADAVDKQNAV